MASAQPRYALLWTATVGRTPGKALSEVWAELDTLQRYMLSGSWLSRRVDGYARAVEVEHAPGGWHPHVHTLLVFRNELTRPQVEKLAQDIRRRYLRAADLRGIPASAKGQHVRVVPLTRLSSTDGDLAKNPCAIPTAGQVKLDRRPILTVTDFTTIVEAHSKDLHPALHLALGAHLRLGELVGLRVKDWDGVAGTITVDGQIIRTEDGLIRTTPKTQSSRRTVVLPAITAEILRAHLARTPKALPNAPLLMRSSGRPVTRSALQSAWKRARAKVGMEQFTFHDLRSSGLTLAAQGGATIPDLMARAGHSTSAAALLYQRTAVERGAVIAASMDAALRAVAN